MEKLFLTDKIYYTDFLTMGKDVYKYPGRFLAFFSSRPFIKALFEDKKRYQEYTELKKHDLIPDVFLFKMSYILNPYMGLRYHHFKFATYKEIGEKMLSYGPIVDVYLKDLIIYHLLSSYMEKMQDTVQYKKEYDFIKKAEKDSIDDENLAYWTLAFDLAQTKILTYNGKEYKDPKHFFSSHLMINDLFNFSSTFLDDKCVLSWLKYTGYEEEVIRFISLSELSDRKEEEANNVLAKELYDKFSKVNKEDKSEE